MKRNRKCKKRSRVVKLLGLTGIVGAVLFFSGCHHRSFEDKVGWAKDRISSKLDLNDQQEAKLDALGEQVIAVKSANRDKRAGFFEEIKKMALSDEISSQQVSSLLAEKRKLHDEWQAKLLPYLQDFHASLTPEQKSKAVELMEHFQKRFRHRK